MGAPSDILVEREGEPYQPDRPPFQPIQEFNDLNLTDRVADDPYASRSFYGGCGYSREYWRNVSGPDYHRPKLSPGSLPRHGPSSPRHASPGLLPSSSSPHLASGSGSPGRGLLKPSSGSPASEASKSPQRSPRPYRPSTYQNPIGSVYHEPVEGEREWGWAGEEGERGWAAAQAGEGWTATRLSEEDRAFAGRNMVSLTFLSGAFK